jgi:hypothetical protein
MFSANTSIRLKGKLRAWGIIMVVIKALAQLTALERRSTSGHRSDWRKNWPDFRTKMLERWSRSSLAIVPNKSGRRQF